MTTQRCILADGSQGFKWGNSGIGRVTKQEALRDGIALLSKGGPGSGPHPGQGHKDDPGHTPASQKLKDRFDRSKGNFADNLREMDPEMIASVHGLSHEEATHVYNHVQSKTNPNFKPKADGGDLSKGSEDQPRDDNGRWSGGGDGLHSFSGHEKTSQKDLLMHQFAADMASRSLAEQYDKKG